MCLKDAVQFCDFFCTMSDKPSMITAKIVCQMHAYFLKSWETIRTSEENQ